MAKQETILLVDDDTDFRCALQEYLESEGFVIEHAENGLAALEFLRTAPQNPAVILLDLMMPLMNGLAFRVRQLDIPEYAAIPVVVMTANYEKLAELLRPLHVLRKPFRLEALLAVLNRVLPSASQTVNRESVREPFTRSPSFP